MTSQQEAIETARRSRRTLYTVAALYVGMGFVMAIPAAINGNTFNTFLGFLIISGALTATVVVDGMLRIGIRVAALNDTMAQMDKHLTTLQPAPPIAVGPGKSLLPDEARVVDLTDAGLEDPSELAAATLERDVYPRLVSAMDEGQVPEATQWTSFTTDANADENPNLEVIKSSVEQPGFNGSHGLSIKNLMRSWVVARRDGNIESCRKIFGALVDIANVDIVDLLREQLDEVTERRRLSFRDEFAQHVRAGRFADALATGERLSQLFPDSELTADFDRLKPHLSKRIQNPDSTPAPTLTTSGTLAGS